ncbi:transposase, partial [Acidobacteriia bacterium AH_259_A11_L15]|nr:transposase [Acidobacteriia bacterium AH_259_A11_L15]
RKRIRLPLSDYRIPGAWYFLTVCCKDKKPHLARQEVRTLIVDIMRQAAQNHHVEIAAYTVLPDHLHLICSAGQNGVVAFVRRLKGQAVAEMRRHYGKAALWQQSFFDHKLRSEESLQEKCVYIWQNPVRRGLARTPQDYPWSGSLLTV